MYQAEPMHRYSQEQAMIQAIKSGHYGPWENVYNIEYREASVPVFSLRTSQFLYANSEIESYLDERRAEGLPLYVALRNPVTLELRGGKIPVPGAIPYDTSAEGVPLYDYRDLGYNPQTDMQEEANPEAIQGPPEQRGVFAEFPANRRGEVDDFDHGMGWAKIRIPLNYPEGQDSRFHPHEGEGWVNYSDLRPIIPRRTPFKTKL